MDINFLLKRQQIALMLAKIATTREIREAQQTLAHFYGDRLRQVAFPTRTVALEAR